MCDLKIRLATVSDYPAIKNFLSEHWNSNFSVVKSKELFDFLYLDEKKINFVVAFRGNELVATLGLTFYDTNNPDVYLSLWRNIDQSGNTGIELIKFVQSQGYRSISSVGTRKEVLIIYQLLGFKTGKMQQHFIPNPELLGQYQILSLGQDVKLPLFAVEDSKSTVALEVEGFNPKFKYFQSAKKTDTFKSFKYLEKRYLSHPSYDYRIFVQKKNNDDICYFVAREVKVRASSVLRLVDCIGDYGYLGEFSIFMMSLLTAEGHEYVDIYSVNLEPKALSLAGFIDITDYGNCIVPNYFEPFMQENEEKFYITNMDTATIFKGDGDADRPYILES